MTQRFHIRHRHVMFWIPEEGKQSEGGCNTSAGQTEAAVNGAHLVRLVEEQAEVGEDHPQLLPAVAVLELPQQVSRQLILERCKTVNLNQGKWKMSTPLDMYRTLIFDKNVKQGSLSLIPGPSHIDTLDGGRPKLLTHSVSIRRPRNETQYLRLCPFKG